MEKIFLKKGMRYQKLRGMVWMPLILAERQRRKEKNE